MPNAPIIVLAIQTLPATGSVPPTAARGPAVAATILLAYEEGSSITYAWATDVIRSYSGRETRIAMRDCPREVYSLPATMADTDAGELQALLRIDGAQGMPFAIALEHEAIIATGDASGAVIPTSTTDYSDWMYPGQTVIVIAPNGDRHVDVLQSFTSSSITLSLSPGAAGKAGARVMPTIPSYLEATQAFGLYAVNEVTITLKARSIYFGNSNGVWPARGATPVTSYTDPLDGDVFPVYSGGIVVEDTSPRAALLGTEITDRGGVLLMTAPEEVADFSRELSTSTISPLERQNLKAFLAAVRGRQKVFLLPSWHADLVPLSDASTSLLIVQGPPLAATDLGSWFGDGSIPLYLQLVNVAGVVAYRRVTDFDNEDDGTTEVQLDSAFAGELALVSILERCRLDSDDVVVTYDRAGIGRCKIPVRAVKQ